MFMFFNVHSPNNNTAVVSIEQTRNADAFWECMDALAGIFVVFAHIQDVEVNKKKIIVSSHDLCRASDFTQLVPCEY